MIAFVSGLDGCSPLAASIQVLIWSASSPGTLVYQEPLWLAARAARRAGQDVLGMMSDGEDGFTRREGLSARSVSFPDRLGSSIARKNVPRVPYREADGFKNSRGQPDKTELCIFRVVSDPLTD